MEKPTHMYDIMQGKRGRGFAKAIIAARFEVCSQAFSRLFSACVPLTPHYLDAKAKVLGDGLGRFITWGSETGATDQTLDYKLRKSKNLHDTVIQLLQQLESVLNEGTQLLETESLQDVTRDLREQQNDSFDDDVGHDGPLSYRAALSNQETSELLEKVSEVLEFIAEIVENLILLGPSLERPYPQDVDVYSSSISTGSENSDQPDVVLARKMFPAASKTLQFRLGHANWKRRISLSAIQQQAQQAGRISRQKGAKAPKRTTGQEVAQDAFNFQKPTLREVARTTKVTLPLMSVPSTLAPQSETASVFSEPKLSRFESSTTLDDSSVLYMKAREPRIPETAAPTWVMQFPKAPVSLENLAEGMAQLFKCTICGYDLEAGSKIKTEEDWKHHVLEDLEPYLCTFDECFSAQEIYSIRDEWYKHELEAHRIKKAWVCSACMKEFPTKNLAEQHLEDHGDEIDDEDIAMMKAMLRQTLSNKPLDSQDCPLCYDRLGAGQCKAHIARHLEQFALTSVNGEESSEEDDTDEIFSQTNDDAMSDRGRKETVLNTFVTEQLKLNLERGKQPPDRLMEEGTGLELLDDMSEYDGSKDTESRMGGPRDESKNFLVEKMLEDLQTSQYRGAQGHSNLKRQTRKVAGAPSVASSNQSLPLLRTWSFPRNEDFMGRDKDLANLYKILSEPGRVCMVSAEGGMGKTALAVEFTWRYEHCYHYIFWVQAETPVGSSETFSQIALQLGLAEVSTNRDTLTRLGREFLEQSQDKRWLLVFDNVDKWDDIDIYTPTKTSATNGSILITTRQESLTAPSRPVNYFRITLQELDMDEGRKLLIHGLPPDLKPKELSLRDPEYKIAGEIATLAGLPLLIIYISGYVKASGCTLLEFWEYWNEWRPNLRIAGTTGERLDSSGRDSVFHISLRDLGGDALNILKIMAFLDSEGIQRELLVRNDVNKPGPMYLRQSRFRPTISNLISQRFVTEKRQEDRENYSVHRVLQARLLRDMNANPQERDEIFRIAFDLVRYHLPRPSLDTPEPSKWNVFKEYLPHVLSLQRAYADPLSITSPAPFLELAELFKDGGVLLWQRYISNDALKLLNTAEKVLDELESDEENLRAEINITINLLLQYFGISHRKESKDRLASILEYRKKIISRKAPEEVTREDENLLNNAYADYANALLEFNDYNTAEPIYKNCYIKCLELGLEIEPSAAFALAKLNHHMAYCKMYRREFGKAIELAEEAVVIVDKLGDKQMMLRYQFDLACIFLQSGAREKALALHREILHARLGLQGRASYFSLQSMYAVAALCHYVGKLDEAEKLMKSALKKASERGSRNFWPDAAVARTKYHLSQVLIDKEGKLTEEAEQLASEAKDVLSKLLPYDPDSITGVKEDDPGALFDHLQPVFGGRFTGLRLLDFVS